MFFFGVLGEPKRIVGNRWERKQQEQTKGLTFHETTRTIHSVSIIVLIFAKNVYNGPRLSKKFLGIGNLDKALPLAGAGLCNNALILLLFLILRQPPFSIPIESPISGGFDAAFLDNFPHTGSGVTSPSISAIPLYSFELDTVGQQTNAATDGGTNDTLTMKGFYHDEKE